MIAATLISLLAAAGPFDVQTISLETPQSLAFLGPGRANMGDVFVLDGHILTEYMTAAPGEASAITLPEGASAFDIVDVDSKGQPDVLAVCGDRLLLYRFPAEGGPATLPEELFRTKTLLSETKAAPSPRVLAIRRENKIVLALPCEKALELRDLGGNLVASYAAQTNPDPASLDTPLGVYYVHPPELGSKDGLEIEVSRWMDRGFELPPDLNPEPKRTTRRQREARQIHDQSLDEERKWEWFPLKTDGKADERVFHAPASHGFGALVRIRDAQAAEAGPKRTYPGWTIVTEEDLPDFNHDGYVDLLLWKAPEPGPSIDSLTRAVTGRTWPVELMVHLYSPQKRRYEPGIASRIQCNVPVAWFLDMADAPVKNCVLGDFNGDGRTDFGCSLAPNNFTVWLYGENGFPATPDFSMVFPNKIKKVVFHADLEGKGRTTIGLRTEKCLYVLRPTPRK